MAAIKTIATNFAIIHRPIKQGDSIFCTGLGKDIADMVVYGAFAYHQRACDFLIGLTGGKQFNNLKLSARDVLACFPLIYFSASRMLPPDHAWELGCTSLEIVLAAAGGHGHSAVASQFRPGWAS